MKDFVHIDNRSNKEYVATQLEDVKKLLDLMSIDEVGLDDNELNLPEKIMESHDRIDFHGFDSLYKKILDIEYQLLCSTVRIEVWYSFDYFKLKYEQ